MSHHDPGPLSPVKLRSHTIPAHSKSLSQGEGPDSAISPADGRVQINRELTKNNIEKITDDLKKIKGNLEHFNKERERINDKYIEKMSSGMATENPDFVRNHKKELRRLDAKIRECNDRLGLGNFILNHLKVAGIPTDVSDTEYSKILIKFREREISFESPLHAQKEILRTMYAASDASSLDSQAPTTPVAVENHSIVEDKDPTTPAVDKSLDSLSQSTESNTVHSNTVTRNPFISETLDNTSSIQVITDSASSHHSRGGNFNELPSTLVSEEDKFCDNLPTIGLQSKLPGSPSHQKNLSLPTNVPLGKNNYFNYGPLETSSMMESSGCRNHLEFLNQFLQNDTKGSTASQSNLNNPGLQGPASSFSPNMNISTPSGSRKGRISESNTTSGQSQSHRSQLLNPFKSGLESISKGIKRRTIHHMEGKKKTTSNSLENIPKNTDLTDPFNTAQDNSERRGPINNHSPGSSDRLSNPDDKRDFGSNKSQKSETYSSIENPSPNPKNSKKAVSLTGNNAASGSSHNNLQYSSESNFNYFENGQIMNVDETLLSIWKYCGVTPNNSSALHASRTGAYPSTSGNSNTMPSNRSNISSESANNHSSGGLLNYNIGNESNLNPVRVCQAFTIVHHMLTTCMQQINAQNSLVHELQEKVQLLSNDLSNYATGMHGLKHGLSTLRDDLKTNDQVGKVNFENMITRIELLRASAEESQHELRSDVRQLKSFSQDSTSITHELQQNMRNGSDIAYSNKDRISMLEQKLEQLTLTSNDLTTSQLLAHKLAELALGGIVLINTLFQLVIRTLNAGVILTDNRLISVFINLFLLFLVLSTYFKDYLPEIRGNFTLRSLLGKEGDPI